jgi:hypothetical protein
MPEPDSQSTAMNDLKTDDQFIREISERLIEGAEYRSCLEGQWDENYKLYGGQHWDNGPPEGLKHFTINRTQNAVLASAAIQTEQRPRIKLEPVENNDVPTFYIKEEAGQQILQAISSNQFQVEGLTEEQLSGQDPISEDQLQALMEPTLQEQDPATGQMVESPIIPEDSFILVDDFQAAQELEKILNAVMDRSNWDIYWLENIVNKGVVGHQPMYIGWDPMKHLPTYLNVNPFTVWVDSASGGIEDSEFLIWDCVKSLDKALRDHPDAEDVLRKNASTSPVIGPEAGQDSGGSLAGSMYPRAGRTNYSRPMVVVRTAWLRNVEFEYTEDEALGRGTVEVQESGDYVLAKDSSDYDVTEEDTARPTEPGADNWPKKFGILQVRIVGDTIIDKRETLTSDIPWAWNVNIPIPYRPYGQGDPERGKSIQEAINRLASILHNHFRYYQSPMAIMPQSVKEAMPKNAHPHAHPGKDYIIPDHLIQLFGGNLKLFVDTPRTPSDALGLLQMLLSEHDRIMGHAEVLQGRTSSAAGSGRAINLLQSAARGVLGLRSLYTERAVKQAIKVIVGMVLDFMPEAEWLRYSSEAPEQVGLALRSRAKRLGYDIRVEVVSGRGQNRVAEQDRAVFLFQNGLISRETAMDRNEVNDVQRELQRMSADQEQAAMAAQSQEEVQGQNSAGQGSGGGLPSEEVSTGGA